MKKWSRLTALVLAFAIVLSTVSGALAQIEIDHGEFQTWVADTKEAEGLSGVISIDEGGEVLVAPSTFTGELNQGPLYTSESTQNLSAYAQGSAPTVDVALGQYSKVELAAPSAGQWQVYLSAADLWVNITGETGSTFALTYAKIKGMIDADGAAKIRCLMGESVTETVNVTVRYEDAAVVVNSTATVSQPMVMSARTVAADAQADEPTGKYTILIEYSFSEKNEIPAEPYSATLAAGTSFTATVKHPVVQGYEATAGESADWNDGLTFTATGVEINVSTIAENKTVKVVYQPTNVEYTVIHKQQNVENDDYTIVETETLEGLTDSIVPDVQKTYPGFYSLLYEKPAIAADGSTVVEVYYDRNYYLMNFVLGEDAYGTEPIYARYGASIGNVPNPTRPGYTFVGWTLGEDTNPDTASIEALPEKMPDQNRTYKAVWKADATAKVTVVFWGENANDENYSYLSTSEIELEPGMQYVYGGATLTCTQEAHKHVDECLNCTEKGHTHSASCYTLTCTESHTHGTGCYSGAYGSAVSDPYGAPASPKEGQVYGYNYKFIYIAGSWYSYNGSTSNGQVAPTTCTPHVHTDYTGECYELTCDEHVHTSGCYKCGKTEHRHNADCFTNDPAYPVASERYLWTFAGSDVVTVAADGSTVVNVYYDRTEFTLTFIRDSSTVKTIKEKWGADIHSNFPIKDGSNTIWWSVPDGTTSMRPGTEFGSLDTMPAENITFTFDSQTSAAVLHYYVEVLDGEAWTYEHAGKHFKLYKDINVTNSMWAYLTYTEEFHDITGFKQYWSDPAFDKLEQGGTTEGINSENWLCYTRNGFDIVYFNPTTQIKADENVPYQKPLTTYYWEPTADKAPAQYEPGSVKFDGWYLNPECTGEKFDFTKQTMPAGPNNENGEVALSLYAKWVPVTHTVEFYLDSTNLTAGTKLTTHPDLTVSHGKKVETVPATPTNGSYKFIGWFYLDENGAEKAFDFANMPVNRDMKVYGKWSSDVLKEYTVKFMFKKADGTEVEIAETISGQALAGFTKTFNAKGGEELYTDYQAGYFPLVQSHSMTIDINATENNDTNVFIFWYVQKDAVPYIVRYVDANGNELHTQLVKADNRQAVVTENFVVIPGYMPDAYQKRLIVNPSETEDWITVTVDGAEVKVHPNNVITFVYVQDTTHAYYKITHYTEDLNGTSWTEYAFSQAVGDIGTPYTDKPMSIDGFTYTKTEYVVDGKVVTEGITDKGVVLTSAGLEINLYYERNSYPYEVRYLEEGTGKQLATPKTSTGLYGAVISESAIDIANYTAVAPTAQTLTIRIEERQTVAKLNIITFYYKENEVTINYVPVGPEGVNTDGTPKETEAGEVSLASETIKVLTGTVAGSTAEPNAPIYKFVGWFTEPECENLVSSDPEFKPTQVNGLWVAATYYAKFEYNVSTLTITKTVNVLNDKTDDPNNAAVKEFTFTITGLENSKEYKYMVGSLDKAFTTTNNGVGTITLMHNETAVIEGVLIDGKVTVTEQDYQYFDKASNPADGKVTIDADGETVAFTNTYKKLKTGDLTINKVIRKGDKASDESFAFTVSLPENPSDELKDQFAEWVASNGNTASITVAGTDLSGSVKLEKLPVGSYVITETQNEGYDTPVYSTTGGVVEVTANGTAAITVTNTAKQNGNISVRKTWEDEDNKYNIRPVISLTLANGTTEVQTISLTEANVDSSNSNQWNGTFEDVPLYDADGERIDYTVIEAELTDYEATEYTSLAENDYEFVQVTNTLKQKDLTITKTVEGDKAPKNAVFQFMVTVDGQPVTSYVLDEGTVDAVNGVVRFVAGKSVTIPNVNVGAVCVVEEINIPVGFAIDAQDNQKQTVKMDSDGQTVEFKNVYTTGNLVVSKTVDGLLASSTQQFTFTLDLKDDKNADMTTAFTYNKYTLNASGDKVYVEKNLSIGDDGTFTLTHGQYAEILDLPTRTVYTVAEEANASYAKTVDGAETGSITVDGAEVAYTNTYKSNTLTIKKTGMASGENAIFVVKNKQTGEKYEVVVPNDGSVTLTLPEGTYSITETGDWTWRYTTGDIADATITYGGEAQTREVENTPTNDKWLDSEQSVTNKFTTTNTTK